MGDLNGLSQVLLFGITFYLFMNDFFILLMSLWKFNEKDRAPKTFLYMLFNLLLHALVIYSAVSANDEEIQQERFWRLQSWVALAIWLRLMYSYLGQI